MAKRTQYFQLIPWNAGRNTTLDPALISTNQLTIADNVLFALDGARRKRGGFPYFDEDSLGADVSIKGIKDYWANISAIKVQKIVAVTDEPKIYQYTPSGVRSELTLKAGSTALVNDFNYVSFEVINEDLVMAFDGSSTPKKWNNQTGTEFEDLGGNPPDFSFCREIQSRLFAAGDPSLPDRLYYSSAGNHEEWQGAGTSGAIDIAIGDGDPEGITAIFPMIKGTVFVAKRTKLYRINISSADDADWTVELVSAGIGCISNTAVAAIGQDDVVFASDRGIHSLAATQNFGDFESQFISYDIQRDFLSFNKARLKNIQIKYIPELNSFAMAVSEDGWSYNNHVHLYNISQGIKAWYRWPLLACESLEVIRLNNEQVLLMGDVSGRLSVYTANDFSDKGLAIKYQVKTGSIYPDNSPLTIKGFKKVTLFYKPKGNYSITCKFKIDNYDVQELFFNLSGAFEALGSQFILGSSVLGFSVALPTVTLPVDGYGHGFSLELVQDGLDQDAAVYGFAVEYEIAGDDQEAPELE